MIKKIFLALALLCGSLQMSNAQEPLMCGFQAGILEAEVMGRGEDIKSAQLDAICQLYDKYATEVDSTSLLAHLQSLDSTFSLDRRTPWIEAMSANEILEIKDSLFQDSAYWVHVKVLPEAFTHFVDQIYRTKVMAASECLIRAHFGREQGNVFAAAGEYGKGLSLIVPLMHCSLVSDILEGKDLGFMLLEEYMTIFDGLTMEALDEELPVVSGEDIPLDLRFRLKVNDRPLINMPVQGWIDEGRIAEVRKSDDKGMVSLHVTQAPHKSGVCAGIIIHSNLAVMLEDNFARPMVATKISSGFPTAKIKLVPFDPTPTFSIQLDELDVDQHDSLAVVLTRLGMVEVPADQDPDLTLSLVYNSERGMGAKHGDYMLCTTSCQMTIAVNDNRAGKQLAAYNIAQFDFLHPAVKRMEEVRRRTIELMMRTAVGEMPKSFSNVNFDKRKYVYDKVRNAR